MIFNHNLIIKLCLSKPFIRILQIERENNLFLAQLSQYLMQNFLHFMIILLVRVIMKKRNFADIRQAFSQPILVDDNLKNGVARFPPANQIFPGYKGKIGLFQTEISISVQIILNKNLFLLKHIF